MDEIIGINECLNQYIYIQRLFNCYCVSGTPSIHNLSHVLNLPSPSFLPVWGSIGDIVPVDTVQHTVVVETDQETPIEQPRPAKPVYTSPQMYVY